MPYPGNAVEVEMGGSEIQASMGKNIHETLS
jgi:hypothetical protein